MKKLSILIFAFCMPLFAFSADDADLLFQQGIDAYNNEHYEMAIESFRQLPVLGYESADIYYNLGNAYYRKGEFASAVWSYEKALLINPSHKDAEFNLEFLNAELFEGVNTVPPSFFNEVWKFLYSLFSPRSWFFIFLLFQLVLPVLILVFFFSASRRRRRIFFYFSAIAFVLYLLSFSVSSWAFYTMNNPSKAVIKYLSAPVRSEPGQGGTDVAVVEQASIVKILDHSENWIKIELPDGNEGWILSEYALDLSRDLP